MPTYDFICESCKKTSEVFCSIDDRAGQTCEHCGGALKQQIVAPYVPQEFVPHFDKGLGVYVNSRQHRKQIMRQKGLIEK